MADLNKVIKALKEKNVADKAIGEFVIDLSNMLATQVQLDIVSVLEEKDFAEIDKMENSQAQVEIGRRYKEKTGTSLEQKSDEILDGFVSGFLTEYQRQKLKEKKS